VDKNPKKKTKPLKKVAPKREPEVSKAPAPSPKGDLSHYKDTSAAIQAVSDSENNEVAGKKLARDWGVEYSPDHNTLAGRVLPLIFTHFS
jgi:hypothetical protein